MIIDNIKNIPQMLPYVNERMKKALEFLQTADLSKLDGKFEVDGRNIHVAISEYDTKPRAEKKAETHIKYIDIQLLISGQERVYMHELNDQLPVVEDLRDSKDAIFYAVDETESHVLSGDRFAVYYPWEVHRPGCDVVDGQSAKVKKMVIKILVE